MRVPSYEPLGAALDRLSGYEHVIKFTEACLSRHRLAPASAYPAAVANVLAVIGSC